MKTNLKKILLSLINTKSIFAFCFFWRIIPLFFMKSINISTDEFTVIGMAAHLAGLDWTAVIRPQYYYGYPMAFVYAPVFFLRPLWNYPLSLYHACLFINALLGMLNTYIIYKILLKLEDNNKDGKRILWLTLMFSLVTSSIALEKVLSNDTLLSVCFYLAIYICISFADDYKRKNIFNSLALGAITVLAYAVNGRGIILLGMILTLWLTMKFFHKTYYLHMGVYLLSTVGLFFIHSQVKAYYVETFFTMEGISLANSGFGDHIEIIENFLSANGWGAFLIAIIGLLYALTFSSYGFCIILLFIVAGMCVSKITHKQKWHPVFETSYKVQDYILILLCVMFIILSIGVTISHFGNFYNDMSLKIQGEAISSFRVDRMFYSRYTATIKPLIIILAYYIVDKLEIKYRMRLLLISDIFIVFLCILFQTINAPLIDNLSYAASNSPELGIVLGNTDIDFKFGVIIARRFILASVALIIFIGIYYMCHLKDKMRFFKISFTSLNIIVGALLLTKFLIPRSEFFYSIPDQNIVKYVNDIYKESPDITLVTDGTEDYLYQVQLPKVKIANWGNELIHNYDEVIILNYEQYELNTLDDVFYEVELESSDKKKILVKGPETILYFRSKNYQMKLYHKER